ncbi:MAG TPA: response regulator transcription factor [Actinomycetota bacterium]|nr:response regulator transcription factor [Actinomycetota bacterium]
MATRVLLIEDDPRIQEVVERGLTPRGFVITCASDGVSGVELAIKLQSDVVLLDLMLPGKSGLQVLQEIRAVKPRLPVIALTALDDTGSKVGGLEAGADDYVTKPFAIEELAARIRARLRNTDESTTVRSGDVTVDLVTHRAFVNGEEVQLSARELALLGTLAQHPNQVLSREQLLRIVWGIDFDPGSNVVDVHVAALRRKIGSTRIDTVRGTGYRFVPAKEAS